MPSYGLTHVVPLVLFGVGLVAVVWLGRRHRAVAQPSRFSRTAAVLVPVATVPFLVVDLVFNFDIAVTLPLHLCDLAWIAATWALWTHRPFPVALTFFWGLTLSIQGILTPALGEDLPHPRYFAFWALHLLIVWAAVYLVIGLGNIPRWRDYGAVVATTLAWATAAYVVNVVADTNYGYLMRKPRTSVLDYLGPWPWYVVEEVAIVLAVWAAMTYVAQKLSRGAQPLHRGPRAVVSGGGERRS